MPTDERTNKQISAEIARRLFGLTVEWREWDWKEDGESGHNAAWVVMDEPPREYWHIVDPYASDHNAAWQVVTEMRKRGYIYWASDMWAGEGHTQAGFSKEGNLYRITAPFGEEPRAICLAVLGTLEQEGK